MSPPKKSSRTPSMSGTSPKESRSADSGDEHGFASGSSKKTIQACERCKRRKIRCDSIMNECANCRENGEVCEVMDRTTGRVYPRNYVGRLEQENEYLKLENASLKQKFSLMQGQLSSSHGSPAISPLPGSISPGYLSTQDYPFPSQFLSNPAVGDSHTLPIHRRGSVNPVVRERRQPSIVPTQTIVPSHSYSAYPAADGLYSPSSGAQWTEEAQEEYAKWQHHLRYGGSGSGSGGGM